MLRPRALCFSTLLNIIYLLKNSLFLWFFMLFYAHSPFFPHSLCLCLFCCFFYQFFFTLPSPTMFGTIVRTNEGEYQVIRSWNRVGVYEDACRYPNNKYICNGTCLARCFLLWSCCTIVCWRKTARWKIKPNFSVNWNFPFLLGESPTQLQVKHSTWWPKKWNIKNHGRNKKNLEHVKWEDAAVASVRTAKKKLLIWEI